MLKISHLQFFIFFLIITSSAGAIEVSGLSFDINHVQKGQWVKARHHLTNDWVEHAADQDQPLTYISVGYRFINNNENKKIDLINGFGYSLVDELGNIYRQIKKPADYNRAVLFVSKNFPSVYPGESYGETLFFEAPLPKAKQLRLIIDAASVGILQKIEIPVPAAEDSQAVLTRNTPSQSHRETAVEDSADLQKSIPLRARIHIISPVNGITLRPSQPVQLQVILDSDNLPSQVEVSGIDLNFIDAAPKTRNVYDLSVPKDCPTGLSSISVTAKWLDVNKSSRTASDSIFVYIKNYK